MEAAADRAAGLELVRVLALNELNERCGCQLIETDQREGSSNSSLAAARISVQPAAR